MLFKVVEKGQDHRSIKIAHPQSRRLDSLAVMHKLQQQAKSVSVSSHCLRACTLVCKLMLSEKRLQQGTNQRGSFVHTRPPSSAYFWKDTAAALNSSGVAV